MKPNTALPDMWPSLPYDDIKPTVDTFTGWRKSAASTRSISRSNRIGAASLSLSGREALPCRPYGAVM